jgi:hypothetical protein
VEYFGAAVLRLFLSPFTCADISAEYVKPSASVPNALPNTILVAMTVLLSLSVPT